MGNSLFNLEPGQVEQCLKELPTGCEMPTITTGLDYMVHIPLHYITACIDLAIGKPEDFTKVESRDAAHRALEKNARIKELLVKHFAIDFSEEIPFHDYANAGIIFADYESDTWEDVLMTQDYEGLKKRGATDKDIQLYVAVSKFQFDVVQHLLDQGAKPDAEIWSDEVLTCMNRIGVEASFLGTIIHSILLEDDCRGSISQDDDLWNLIGLAAHEKMYDLLKPYCKNK